ncbi:MAG: metalloregulator ArsR/SmtB family transcription factor [Ruminococcus sp.]|jgi:ArsR family transcriptional regulator|nr:metalloregulator ArsR/SmtB family transcription factor [Ruminococcus sp.]
MQENTELTKDTIELEKIKENLPDEEIIYNISELYKVFSDSTRVRILCVLLQSALTVGDISKLTEMSPSAISHQLRLLKQTRLVKFTREGKNLLYSIADEHIRTIIDNAVEHISE